MKIDSSSAGREADLEEKEILEKSVINTKSVGRHATSQQVLNLQAPAPTPALLHVTLTY
jgi:hypothetical protein